MKNVSSKSVLNSSFKPIPSNGWKPPIGTRGTCPVLYGTHNAIAAIDATSEERRAVARNARSWRTASVQMRRKESIICGLSRFAN